MMNDLKGNVLQFQCVWSGFRALFYKKAPFSYFYAQLRAINIVL